MKVLMPVQRMCYVTHTCVVYEVLHTRNKDMHNTHLSGQGSACSLSEGPAGMFLVSPAFSSESNS